MLIRLEDNLTHCLRLPGLTIVLLHKVGFQTVDWLFFDPRGWYNNPDGILNTDHPAKLELMLAFVIIAV